MRANEFGTSPKRPQREGSRPSRGHEPQPRYITQEQSVEETARMSAAVKLQRAFDRERAKSTASHERGKAVLAQARADWEKKQAAEKNKEQQADESLKSDNPCWKGYHPVGTKKKGGRTVPNCVPTESVEMLEAELEALAEEGKASRALCASSKPDNELGASQLSSCKSQGLRARDGNKSHKLGKSPKSRVKVGGHKIKGAKYGGPLPDWS